MQPMRVTDRVARELSLELERAVRGEVRFDDGSRALYATDGSLYRQVPVGVVIPRGPEDVVETLALCREYEVPVLPRGAGTSLAGQCCNVAVVLDFSKYMNQIEKIDPQSRLAVVQPGCILDHLRMQAQRHHLTFAPDPSTHSHNTLGGMLGNNSCGVHSIMGGRTTDNVHSMEVLTYDGERLEVGPTTEQELERLAAGDGRQGEIHSRLKELRDRYAERIKTRFPDIPRRVSGYNLDELLPERGCNVARALVGSEGTCVTVLSAKLELVPSPPIRALLVVGYKDVYSCGDHVQIVMEYGPVGLEGMDSILIESMAEKNLHPDERRQLPQGESWLLVEFGGDTVEEAKSKARRLQRRLEGEPAIRGSCVLVDPEQQENLWKVRESGLAATSRHPVLGASHPGWEDAAVPPDQLGSYLRDFRRLMHKHGYEAALYGHFGQGCVHCRINFDMESRQGMKQWRAFMQEAADLVVSYGGSLSGEHGDGQVRAELLPRMYGDEITRAFHEFKAIWDPDWKMNPGKVVAPYPMEAFLRKGPDTRLPALETDLDYPADHHSFAEAANRCVGIGACRDSDEGIMCPSYRATLEEKDSTRGRARMLFEMLKGDVVEAGWRSKAVRESLDLCLSCKACKSDCPVGVDMATLKAEFMSHHYSRRLRPASAYSMGLIWWWSRLATHIPGLVNSLLSGRSGLLIKKLGGIAPQRDIPRYAATSFTRWFSQREPVNSDGRPVILWPDTFNNYFYPDTLKAAVRVLEDAGCSVRIPGRPLCCALPLFAEGMLTLARHQLGTVLDTLEDDIISGIPLVGLEPACVASFRDELTRLFPADERAHRLSEQSLLLSEYLRGTAYRPRRLERSALVHIHCHHHASLDIDAEKQLLGEMGLDLRLTPDTCCGMAGSFGFKRSNYKISQKIAAHKLLPALRECDTDTLLVSNGFSCREQVVQATGRMPLHLSQVLELAMREGRPQLQVISSNTRVSRSARR